MPYNTTPIRPRKEVTGTVQLPCECSQFTVPLSLTAVLTCHAVSRVKKIIAVDPDINICSNNAAFAITLATVRLPDSLPSVLVFVPSTVGIDNDMQEMFIQYLAEQGHNMAKLDRKPRRNVQYKDLCKFPPSLHLTDLLTNPQPPR